MVALTADMVAHTQRFLAQISLAVQQMLGETSLPLPPEEIVDVHASASDYDLVHRLEGAINEWVTIVQNVLTKELQRTPDGPGPLAEIEFWRQRNAVLGSVFEQMNSPTVQKIVQVVELGSQDKKLLR